MISKSDLDHAVRLLVEVVKGLNHDRYNEFIQYV
jgi:hypothetical protein